MIRAENLKEIADATNQLSGFSHKKKYKTQTRYGLDYLLVNLDLIVRKAAEDGLYSINVDCSSFLKDNLNLCQKGIDIVMNEAMQTLNSYGYLVRRIDTDSIYLEKNKKIIIRLDWRY